MDFLDKLIHDFRSTNTLLELAILAASMLLAYGVAGAAHLRHDAAKPSVWLGRSVLDGALFPLLALLFTVVARAVAEHYTSVFVLRLAVQILLSLAVIRLVARVLTKTFPRSTAARLSERIFSWLAWGVAALGSLGVLPEVMAEMNAIQFALGKTNMSLLGVIEGLLAVGLVVIVVLWLSATFEERVIDETIADLSMRKMVMNLTRIVLLTVGLLFALSAVGVDLTALSVLGGGLGVGLGFGMQKIASNYVSGFLVLLERALRIGDNVRVDGFEGRITDIRTRYTVIRAGNGRESIVPNESLITQRVENLSAADLKFGLSTNIVVGADSDVATVQRVLTEAALSQPRVLRTPEPAAYLVDFAPDGLEFSLNFSISDPANGQVNVRSAVNIAMLEGLRRQGIDIPFPQRVVHIQGAELSKNI